MTTTTAQDPRDAIAARINALPALQLFGAKVLMGEPGEASVSIDELLDFHRGGLETSAVNGMTLMGLMDAAMCAAALGTMGGRQCATGEISVTFLKPVFGKSVTAHGKVKSQKNNLLACEATVLDAQGNQRATATAMIHLFSEPRTSR